jgi:DNA-directed RNA polymerase subunit RPC12/RpoP
MSRRSEEFYCTECKKYFLTYLRESMWGNYTIECPNCGHHHFRVIKDGLVTEQRHSDKMGTPQIILCLKSTIRATPWHNDPAFRRTQIKAYNGGANANA